VELIERLGSPTVQWQFDMYHAQRGEGNLIRLLETNIAHLGHVQIADSPERGRPGTGEINWRNVLARLEQLDYRSYVALEYKPTGRTVDSLDWLPPDGRVSCDAHDILLP
jgi:hydroxypyruvate isomerase